MPNWMRRFKSACDLGRIFRLRLVIVAATMYFVIASIGSIHASDTSVQVPQLVHFQYRGLDPKNNQIDHLIYVFGFVCVTRPELHNCRLERELVAYLKKLPPYRTEVTGELTSLGAKCIVGDVRTKCIYEKSVEVSAWVAGANQPASVRHEEFRISITVSGARDPLEYDAVVERELTSETTPSKKK